LQFTHRSPILLLSFGTMDINTLVISGSDPGAVPGGSTKSRFRRLHLRLFL